MMETQEVQEAPPRSAWVHHMTLKTIKAELDWFDDELQISFLVMPKMELRLRTGDQVDGTLSFMSRRLKESAPEGVLPDIPDAVPARVHLMKEAPELTTKRLAKVAQANLYGDYSRVSGYWFGSCTAEYRPLSYPNLLGGDWSEHVSFNLVLSHEHYNEIKELILRGKMPAEFVVDFCHFGEDSSIPLSNRDNFLYWDNVEFPKLSIVRFKIGNFYTPDPTLKISEADEPYHTTILAGINSAKASAKAIIVLLSLIFLVILYKAFIGH